MEDRIHNVIEVLNEEKQKSKSLEQALMTEHQTMTLLIQTLEEVQTKTNFHMEMLRLGSK